MTEQKKRENSVDGNTKSIRLNTWFFFKMSNVCARTIFQKKGKRREENFSWQIDWTHAEPFLYDTVHNIQLELKIGKEAIYGET